MQEIETKNTQLMSCLLNDVRFIACNRKREINFCKVLENAKFFLVNLNLLSAQLNCSMKTQKLSIRIMIAQNFNASKKNKCF